MINVKDIQIRDPFILLENDKYYMFGSTDKDIWDGPGSGFDLYTSHDLVNFEGPVTVFHKTPGFWGEKNFWAPEVHKYNGKYYLFASFYGNGRRGSQILVSDTIDGIYEPHSDGPVTPENWDCLDATLYVENGIPYTIFCHEWLDVGDGEIILMELSHDLKHTVGKPQLLFTATSSGWADRVSGFGRTGYVTDGPYIYKMQSGDLCMIWSSFKGDYALAAAYSRSGVKGPWVHQEQPVYIGGGHGMIFKRKDGALMLSVHQPNNTPFERAVFIEIKEVNGRLAVTGA